MIPNSRTFGTGEVRAVSMGFLVEDESSALMWRGLMLQRGVQHFLQDVAWGADLDYLLIDMPPGTGDVQMGVAKLVPRAEVLVVTTPAAAAQKVAARVVSMARKNFLRVAGVIENMSVVHAASTAPSTPLFGVGRWRGARPRGGRPAARADPARAVGGAGRRRRPARRPRRRPGGRVVPRAGRAAAPETVPPIAMADCSARIELGNVTFLGTKPA